MRVKPFTGLVPSKDNAQRIASVPYDVVNTEEARALAEGNPHSFLHVVRAEIDFPPGTDPYGSEIYQRAKTNLEKLQADKLLMRDDDPGVFLYRQVMDGHAQIGITLLCHIDDYGEGLIKKHEKTRPDKEKDRTVLTDVLSANTGPVFLTYRDTEELNARVGAWVSNHEPVIDFVDVAGVQHTVWKVTGAEADLILGGLERVPVSYIADGHHRSASYYRVGSERRQANPSHTGDEAYNWFLGVMFPASHLQVLPYNRVVRDLAGMTPAGFLDALREHFEVNSDGSSKPVAPHSVCLYLDGQWHTIKWQAPSGSPVDRLDVSVLQDRVLSPLLGIDDPRTNQRIQFVGGIRGTAELEKLVNGGQFQAAFSMFPTTVSQLMDIADAGEIMPPKSTWFEPKLRSGLFVYTF